jgi:hypothetical protein
MRTLVKVYRAWPFRPHCTEVTHVLLCRILRMNVGEAKWCPANDA